MEEIKAYKCSECKEIFDSEFEALKCEFKHKQAELANKMLDMGCPLRYINYICGFDWNLREELEEVTKDNCFVFSHWQCCNKPAYQIMSIEYGGVLNVRGKGGWMGYYGDKMFPNKLPTPHSKEELYKYVG